MLAVPEMPPLAVVLADSSEQAEVAAEQKKKSATHANAVRLSESNPIGLFMMLLLPRTRVMQPIPLARTCGSVLHLFVSILPDHEEPSPCRKPEPALLHGLFT